MPRPRSVTILVAALVLGSGAAVVAQRDDMPDVEIETQAVAPGLHLLTGRGGNMAVCTGPDGAFLIDDQYAPLTARIQAAVGALDPGPIRFVLNTHWHSDHTGGNENLGKAGALLVAHANVRRRLSTEQYMAAFKSKTPPSPEGAWPVVTFSDSISFHLNGQDIRAWHAHNAHTDGDAIVFFPKINAVHMGDVFFNGMYPFIDVSSGGSIDGVIAAVSRVLGVVDAQTKVIPGHGAVTDRAGLQAYHAMLVEVRAAMAKEIAAGKNLEQIQAAKPAAKYDATLGGGFIKPDKFVEILHSDLARR